MKALKVGLAAMLLAFTVNGFAANSADMGRKKKHKCNNECTREKHNYLHGEKKHKCGEACHKM